MKQRNLVSKHARTFNVAAVHVDRKKASKRGKIKHKEYNMIDWKNTRKAGKVATGTEEVGSTPVQWNITKSPGGLSYQLHLGEVGKVPMITRPTINDCKVYAEAYF